MSVNNINEPEIKECDIQLDGVAGKTRIEYWYDKSIKKLFFRHKSICEIKPLDLNYMRTKPKNMKTLIITALAALSLTSCERRYGCVETQTITANGVTTISNTTKTFTGTKKEMEEWRTKNSGIEVKPNYRIVTTVDCK